MAEFYFSANLSNERLLCIAPLSDQKAQSVGQILDNPLGYFLYECSADDRASDITVIARLLSEEAVFRLKELLGME